MPENFSSQLRRRSGRIWRAIETHAFLRELHAGTLPMKRFTYFILQDYVYLLDFAQVLCLGGAKSPNLKTLELFCRHALAAVEVERSFHAAFGKTLGLSAKQLDRVPKGPITQAYIGHLQSVARGGSLGELVAAVLPCYWIYGEVGRRLYRNRPSRPKIYRQWIETYAADTFWRPVREQIGLMNQLGMAAHSLEKKRMTEHFMLSSRYEYMFWQQAYGLESWPV
ncbi:MAG TPA: thiaminase II [Candidatus Binatia bacterium]|jgi:thiaminase/transcriptional activator TenA